MAQHPREPHDRATAGNGLSTSKLYSACKYVLRTTLVRHLEKEALKAICARLVLYL